MLTKLHPLSLTSFAVAVLCLVGVIVLSALNKTVPAELWYGFSAMIGSGSASGLVASPAKAALPSAPKRSN